MAKPISRVYLLDVPLEGDLQNTLYFANVNAQRSYFESHIGKTYLNVSYQADNTPFFRCPDQLDKVRQYNYIMFQNPAYSNKWFYGFITRSEYKSDGLTDVYFEIDPIQTFLFDYTVNRSFVEREHVNDDTIGKHTLPEGLDLGEFEIVDHRDIPMHQTNTPSSDWLPCFCVTTLPEGCVGAVDGRVNGDNGYIGGVFNSLKFFSVHTMTAAKKIIEAYESGSVTTEAIVNVYMVPSICVNMNIQSPTTVNSYQMYPLNNYVDTNDLKLQQPTKLSGNYTPVNNKLYTSPFSYVYMSNNVGEDITFDWQDFPLETIGGITMPTITYYKAYVPTASVSAKLILKKYKNYNADNTGPTQMANYGINFGKVPVCAWTTDYYTNWLTQNGVNLQANAGHTILGVAGGLAGMALAPLTGGVSAAIGISSTISAANSVMSTMAEVNKAKTVPLQSNGNAATGDLLYALKRNSISCYFMSIRKEVAEIIDGYFSMFGYKVNSLKVPNVAHRQNWWYTKTVNANITGNVPNEYIDIIRQAYDKGITFWRTPANFLNYSLSNGIV